MRKFSLYCNVLNRPAGTGFLAGEREQKNGLWCGRFDGVVDDITNRVFTFGCPGVTIESGEMRIVRDYFRMCLMSARCFGAGNLS